MTVPPTSGYNPAVAQDRPTRPGVVTLAGYLLFLLAGLQIANLVVSLATMSTMRSVFEEAYRGTNLEGSASTIVALTVGVTAFLAVLFGIGFIVLGVLDLKGKQPARIVTWVVAGLMLCCLSGSLASNGIGASFGRTSANGVDMGEVQRKITEGMPDWVQPTQLGVGLLQILSALAVIVLLALPAANAYFRRRPQQEWTPPAYPNV
jgi:hypothetical protein